MSDKAPPGTVDEGASVILELALQDPGENVIDLSSCATAGRFRLVDRVPLSDPTNPVLRILEFNVFPLKARTALYCAISYIWRGNPPHPAKRNTRRGSIVVEGARDGDPVSIDVMHHACMALPDTVRYLWLDRLCIMQTNREDKAWQIQKMFDIYKKSDICFVLPGGVGRLVGLDEETDWLLRGWTLQEAVAPSHTDVLFSMEGISVPPESTQGALITNPAHVYGSCPFTYVLGGSSGLIGLKNLLWATRVSSSSEPPVIEFLHTKQTVPVSLKILGDRETRRRELFALTNALDTVWTGTNFSRHALWQSSFFRTSKRPVDMVFSIMHLFGVTLDPHRFKSTDRIAATIALAQTLLRNYNKADWLLAGWNEPPDHRLSSFPELPDTSVALPPRFRSTKRDVSRDEDTEPLDIRYRFRDAAPEGSMDDEGYFHFTAKAVEVVQSSDQPVDVSHSVSADASTRPSRLQALDGSVWDVLPPRGQPEPSGSETERVLYVAVIGITTARRAGGSYEQAKAVLLQQHAPRRFHRLPVFYELERTATVGWQEMALNMGPVK
ncbi:hypothetical protein C8Q76DRAFT_169967 [Earliella scabrosa]|nr:hypothetical protein C8Q76DRAFT_169967 [Earliella scabrosa]